jgi:signal transduction histidine kinase
MYTLTIYPTQTFFEVYQTGNPLYAAVAVAAIITVTTLCSFGIYDYYVRREFQSKQQLLDQKRQFVRYVSHEVRTPLNSVCMGLHLLQTEIAGSLGHVDLTSLLRDDELTQGDDHEDTGRDGKEKLPSWLRLAHDVESNARVSVDILNDLLNYDKIQRGTMD